MNGPMSMKVRANEAGLDAGDLNISLGEFHAQRLSKCFQGVIARGIGTRLLARLGPQHARRDENMASSRAHEMLEERVDQAKRRFDFQPEHGTHLLYVDVFD